MVLAACMVPLMGAVQEAVAPEVRSLAQVGFQIISCRDDSGSLVEPLRGLCTLKTKALSLLGMSDKLVLRQSLQKCVVLISCQNV